MNFLASKLKFAAMQYGDRVAVVHREQQTTYSELYQRIVRLTNALNSKGLQKGERVAVLIPNCVEAFELDAACTRLGVVRVPLLTGLAAGELLQRLKHAAVHAMVTTPDLLAKFDAENIDLQAVVEELNQVWVTGEGGSYEDLINSADDVDFYHDVEPDDLYALFYTSGTTGTAKAAMCTHSNWKHIALDWSFYLPEKDVVNAFVVPVTHSPGHSVLPTMHRGGRCILLDNFDAEGMLQAIEKHSITNIMLVPSYINEMLQVPDAQNYDLSSLHRIIFGSTHLPPDRISDAVELFGPVLAQAYGQTEAGIVTVLPLKDHFNLEDPQRKAQLSSPGFPIFSCAVRIVDENDNTLPSGEIGEIAVSSESVMPGYWRAPEKTAEVLVDGWMHTGDMGRFDEDGYLHIHGRRADMFISGGEAIFPAEIENVLSKYPGVYESVAIGVPDNLLGESIKALVVMCEGASATEEDIIEYCASVLVSTKVPKSVKFMDELPKSSVGKILRTKARESYWEESDL